MDQMSEDNIQRNPENQDLELDPDRPNETNRRTVRFPDDETIVSDYFEAKGYWNESRFCSSEELMNAYKKICDKYSIKPIPIVLEQIKGIDMILCRERYEMLNFSSIKLDIKHIECLEEIFKRVQFKTLNFESCNIDDEAAIALFEIIEYYESCLKLNLSYNTKLNYPGFNSFSKMLKKTPCIDTIDLKGIMFTDVSIPPLNRALRSGTHLRVLHLEHSNICSKNLLILSSAIKLNIYLKELHLANNRLVPSDGIQLGSLLKVNKYLEVLDVRNNSLGDVGIGHMCDGLVGQAVALNNAALLTNNHDPSANSLHDPSYQQSSPPGYPTAQGLLCLILWSNSITYGGMYPLAEAIRLHPTLQSLNLGNNPITSEGIHVLKDGLLRNRSLMRLSLPCCRINCEGGVALAEYIADSRQLTRLDLRENDIKTAGLLAISLSIRLNQSITRLDLDAVSKRDGNVKGYAESQLEYIKAISDKVQANKLAALEQQEAEFNTHSQLEYMNSISVNEAAPSDDNKQAEFNMQNNPSLSGDSLGNCDQMNREQNELDQKAQETPGHSDTLINDKETTEDDTANNPAQQNHQTDLSEQVPIQIPDNDKETNENHNEVDGIKSKEIIENNNIQQDNNSKEKNDVDGDINSNPVQIETTEPDILIGDDSIKNNANEETSNDNNSPINSLENSSSSSSSTTTASSGFDGKPLSPTDTILKMHNKQDNDDDNGNIKLDDDDASNDSMLHDDQ